MPSDNFIVFNVKSVVIDIHTQSCLLCHQTLEFTSLLCKSNSDSDTSKRQMKDNYQAPVSVYYARGFYASFHYATFTQSHWIVEHASSSKGQECHNLGPSHICKNEVTILHFSCYETFSLPKIPTGNIGQRNRVCPQREIYTGRYPFRKIGRHRCPACR